jgi:hypothetical protein
MAMEKSAEWMLGSLSLIFADYRVLNKPRKLDEGDLDLDVF